MSKIYKKDPLGKALKDYFNGKRNIFIEVKSSLGEEDSIWVNQFFRKFEEMPQVEKIALKNCEGRILDVGAGAGAHSKYLLEKGHPVKAIDISPGAVEVMINRGLEDSECIDFFDLEKEAFDTILMMMNGIGIVGELKQLERFFAKSKQLLKKKGRIIFDSSDISYMFQDAAGDYEFDFDRYYGEVTYQMKYENILGEKFNWLFVNYHTLKTYAEKSGFSCKQLFKSSQNAYSCICQLEE